MKLGVASDVFIAPGARLLGEVRMASGANVWFGASLDGSAGLVEIDEGANVQDNGDVRGVSGATTRLGRRAAMGHNAQLIGAVVEEDVLIAIGARVMEGARVGTLSIVAANATVPKGMTVPPRSLVIGNGQIVRQVNEVEIERIRRTAREYLRLSGEYRTRLGTTLPK